MIIEEELSDCAPPNKELFERVKKISQPVAPVEHCEEVKEMVHDVEPRPEQDQVPRTEHMAETSSHLHGKETEPNHGTMTEHVEETEENKQWHQTSVHSWTQQNQGSTTEYVEEAKMSNGVHSEGRPKKRCSMTVTPIGNAKRGSQDQGPAKTGFWSKLFSSSVCECCRYPHCLASECNLVVFPPG
ncbi:hypothetical protein Ciccas_005791 [Cichlidogyrus casuarinus]|uniref:Uncharacterized protein n=1 Tax=Cichlidogyrus casuarinus TaxID=1844966 RepID=A0ABD2Q7Y2_9PLAT